MAKKRAAPEVEKREETNLTAEQIEAAGDNIGDLATKLLDVAKKMRSREVVEIDSKGWRNLLLAIEKLGGAIGSVERGYRKASIEPIAKRVADERQVDPPT